MDFLGYTPYLCISIQEEKDETLIENKFNYLIFSIMIEITMTPREVLDELKTVDDYVQERMYGLTCKNSSASNKSTIDLGLSGTIGGLTISPEVYLPIAGGNFYPSASLGISLDPNKFRTDKIDAQIDVLDQRQELIDIESARRKLESTITEEELELQNILWEKTKYDEYYQTNKSLEEDMLSWYKMGVITESKYLSARVSREEYEVLKIINLIDMLLYNDTVSSYFYSDAQ